MEEWQRRMVDPNWGGGKFGSSGGVGGGPILWGLPGIGLSRLPIKTIPSVFKKQLNPKELLRQLRIRRQLDRTEPRMYPPVRPVTTVPHHIRHMLRPQFGGRQRGTWFPDSSGKQVFRPATRTAADLQEEYLKASARHNRRLTKLFKDPFSDEPLLFRLLDPL